MMSRPFPGPLFPLAAIVLLAIVAGPVVAVLASMSPLEAASAFAGEARDAVRVSLIASLGATALATVLGVPAGYYLAHAAPRLRAAALFGLALPLAFPPVASGLMLIYAVGPNSPAGALLGALGLRFVDSLPGVAAAEFFVSGSLVALAACAGFAALDPLYADAARTLGAGEWRIFARVALPAALPGIGAGIAFAWLRAAGEYGATSIVAYHPASLPVALYVTLSAEGVRQALALCYGFVVLTAAVLAAAWVLRRGVVR